MSRTEGFPKLEVGMSVWLVLGRNRLVGGEATVTKVDRVYAQLGGNYRIRLDDWTVDGCGYSSPGAAYPSETHYLEEKNLQIAWDKLRTKVRDTAYGNSQPTSVSIESINQAMKLLGLGDCEAAS